MRVLASLLWFVVGAAQATPLATGRLAWDQPNDSRIESYHMHCGTAPATYTRDVVAPGGASATEISLVDAVGALGEWWCVATSNCAACGEAGEAMESDPSNEVYVLAEASYQATHPGVLQDAWATKTAGGASVMITPIGSVSQFTSTAQSGTQSISIPVTADYLVMHVTGWTGASNVFSGNPPTVNGVAMTASVVGDAGTHYQNGVLFTLADPDTGSQDVAWSWSDSISDGVRFAWRAYSGVSGIRDSDADPHPYTDIPFVTKTLSSQSGDLIVAALSKYADGDGITFNWTGAASQQDYGTRFNNVVASWAEVSPTGNQTVQVSTSDYDKDGVLMAIVLEPATGGASFQPSWALHTNVVMR